MKITIYIIRFLLAVLFIMHGIEKIFIKSLLPAEGINPDFETFYKLLTSTGFLVFVGFFQLLCGLLLIFKRTSLLGAVMLFPLILCLVMTHIFISKTIYYVIFDTVLLAMNVMILIPRFKDLKTVILQPSNTLF